MNAMKTWKTSPRNVISTLLATTLLMTGTLSTRAASGGLVKVTDSPPAFTRLDTILILPGELPAVSIQGNVQYQRVLWHNDLTLARALLLAQYRGAGNPFGINVVRNGRRFPINMNQFLRGQVNPLLEPGDLVEVR